LILFSYSILLIFNIISYNFLNFISLFCIF